VLALKGLMPKFQVLVILSFYLPLFTVGFIIGSVSLSILNSRFGYLIIDYSKASARLFKVKKTPTTDTIRSAPVKQT
jgi:hypothetical protein